MRKKKIFGLLIIVALFMFLFGCENLNQGSGNGKEVPVYQGMEVTGTLENQKAYNPPLLFSSGGDDEGDGINQQNPFSKNTGEMIEDELKKELGTGTSESAEYYTSKNQDFYITIKLSNPDDFVILSFNLNGVRYASYQFHDNSDLENIILKVNSGDVSGIKEYTIDEIKYVDGTEIKDVIFAGDRTVKVGVTYDAIPDAAISNLKIESTSISLNAQVSDLSNLIDLYDSPLKIYLYDGNNLIREKELVVGANEVLFDKLLQNTLYQYAIVTRYDSLDGNGSQMVILEKLAFYTNRIIKLTNVAATQESVSFDVVIDDKAEVGSLTAIELYKDNELVKSLEDLTSREFSGLLSNNEYEIRAIYTYNLDDGVDRAVTFTQAVTTKSKTLPRYTSNLERGASSVVLDLTVEDPDSIGKLVSIELYKDNELVTSLEDFTEIKFTGLLSNYAYEIVVNFTYDLNEGEGEQPGAMFISFRTKFKNSPYIKIKNVVETQTSIGFELDIIDQDQVGSLTAIELYKDNELVKSLTDLTLREFSELLSNNEYEIKAIYTYDMNDGLGERVLTITHQVTTKPKEAPTIEIVDVVETQTSVGFDFTIVDLDQVGAITAIELYKDNELVESLTDLTLKEFGGLLSNNKYEIKVTYTYDLNDGYGTRNITDTKNILTPKIVPSVDVIFTHHRVWKVSYEIVIYDPELALTLSRVYANLNTSGDYWYPDYNQYELSLDLTGTFDGISSASTHTLYIEYLVDLNDGNGGQTITLTKEFKTPKCNLGYSIESFEATSDSLTFNLIMHDPDNVGQAEVKYELYNSDKTVLVSNQFDTNPEMVGPWSYTYSYTYNDLLSNNTYILVISFKGDLEDGLGFREFVQELSLTTKPKVAPTIEIVDVVETQTSIGFDFTIEDVDLVGNVTSIEIYKNNELVESLSDLTLREFTGLLSNNLYEIRVGYTYDLNDGVGVQNGVATHQIITLPQEILIEEFSILNQQISSGDMAVFNVNALNIDDVAVKYVVVNGKKIELDSTSTTTTFRFKLLIEDEMGTANYIIEKFILADRDIELTVNNNNSIEFFVIPNIEILNAIQFEGKFYGDMYDKYNITFNQKITNYITKVTANGVNPTVQVLNNEDITIVDDNTIQIPITSSQNRGKREFKIVSMELTIDSITYVINIDYKFSVYIVTNNIRNIETVDDLLAAANSGEISILQNDIDFTGINWNPINFEGVLLGNGYKFTNLKIVDYSSPQCEIYSIFNAVYGVISDLNIENIFISVQKNNSIKVATLAIENHGVINNVSITGSIEVISDGTSNIGGIVVGNYSLITNSNVNITIFNDSKTTCIGGAVASNSLQGKIDNLNITTNINSNTDLTYSSHYIGGLVGLNDGYVSKTTVNTIINVKSSFIYTGGVTGYNNGTIKNSYTEGLINSTLLSGYSYGYSAGFVGFNSQGAHIKNSYSKTNTTVDNSLINWSSGFVGENQGIVENSFSSGEGFNNPFVKSQSGTFNNNYSIESGNVNQNSEVCYKNSVSDIISIIIDLWDHNVWDFSQIDNINITHPVLK